MTGQSDSHRQASLAGRIHSRIAEHARLRELCDRLEAIADHLPALPEGGSQCLMGELSALLRQREEDNLLDMLLYLRDPTGTRQALAARIRSQQVTDLVHAQDLGVALAEAKGGDAASLGYMLRCFFLGCRRALAFEELAILYLGGDTEPGIGMNIGAAIAPRDGRMD
ncbi:hypothetical protein [Roseococcus sp.]|uniref:hypothetical protein n=1 Tax=Roseococcus sp. TaxID=2109646 RepID=UPI003BAA0A96